MGRCPATFTGSAESRSFDESSLPDWARSVRRYWCPRRPFAVDRAKTTLRRTSFECDAASVQRRDFMARHDLGAKTVSLSLICSGYQFQLSVIIR